MLTLSPESETKFVGQESAMVYEMSTKEPVELSVTDDAWIQREIDAKIEQERWRALVDDRVAAGYEGA
jgi:hypothetical protein